MNRGCLITLAAMVTGLGVLTAQLWPALLWAHSSAGLTCQMALIAFLLYRHE